jgi:DNA recombination protein RmuC
MELWLVVALTVLVAGVAVWVLLRQQGTQQQAEAAGALRSAESRQLERRVVDLMTAQSELAGRLQQLVETSAHAQAAAQESQTRLTAVLEERLETVSLRLGQGLSENTAKTTETLGEINTRLSLIDQAQKNITELSSQVVSLQDILSNKQARGAFGEIQLEDIVRKALAPDAFVFQATLSNKTRVDCLINLPWPPGPIAVDAKFPLEGYRAMRAASDEAARESAAKLFRLAVLKHATAIHERYSISGETAESTLMFLPSEAIYAELHSNFPDVIDRCHAIKVYVVSPTTLMATLHTVRAILKDARMHQQAAVIQKEVGRMMDDVRRLRERVGKLQTHFSQTEKDVQDIITSADKLARHGERIANVDLGSTDNALLLAELNAPQGSLELEADDPDLKRAAG